LISLSKRGCYQGILSVFTLEVTKNRKAPDFSEAFSLSLHPIIEKALALQMLIFYMIFKILFAFFLCKFCHLTQFVSLCGQFFAVILWWIFVYTSIYIFIYG